MLFSLINRSVAWLIDEHNMFSTLRHTVGTLPVLGFYRLVTGALGKLIYTGRSTGEARSARLDPHPPPPPPRKAVRARKRKLPCPLNSKPESATALGSYYSSRLKGEYGDHTPFLIG